MMMNVMFCGTDDDSEEKNVKETNVRASRKKKTPTIDSPVLVNP